MFPLLWFWAPQFHFPFSGSVAQDIEPDNSWFFKGIPSTAGNADLEKQIFDIASYGKQLGLIEEVLLSVVSPETIDAETAAQSLNRLKAIRDHAESLKAEQKTRQARKSGSSLYR